MTFSNPNFDPYAHIDGPLTGNGFDDVREVVHHAYKEDRTKGLVVEADIPRPTAQGEQLRDLINNAEIDEADKRALMHTAVNALSAIIKQPQAETFQPKPASHHVNNR